MMEQHTKTIYGQLAAAPVEKRSCPRYPFSTAVEAIDIQADTRIVGRLSDISRNGCYVDTINPFAKDAAVSLTITRDLHSFKSQAKVVYSKIGMGMGLLFTTAEPEQLRVLGSWLGELSGGKVAAQDAANLVHLSETRDGADHELRKIVGELIALLNVKNLLNDTEGMVLLRKLSK
ncbi:MAG: PilZ domain-containing protein [Candidatus Acidiferrum sp.]